MKDMKEFLDSIDDHFKKGTSIRDHADGMAKMLSVVTAHLIAEKDDYTISKLVSFLFINFPDNLNCSSDTVKDLKQTHPSVWLLKDPGECESDEFEKLDLVDKAMSLKFMLDDIINDIVVTGSEDKLRNAGSLLYNLAVEATDSLKSELSKKHTPSAGDLDKMWDICP